MAKKGPSAQDLLLRQQLSGSIGREGDIAQYRENLLLPPASPDRRILVNVYGAPAVGKSNLVIRLRNVAVECGALTAVIDQADNIIAAMTAIADQLDDRGVKLPKFRRHLKQYNALHHKHTKNADPSVASAFTKLSVTVGLNVLKDVPFAGALTSAVPTEVVANSVDALVTSITSKVHDRAKIDLLINPIKALTPTFLASLEDAAQDHPIALFFDAYDQTQPILGAWLLQICKRSYGTLPAWTVITISGRQPLNPLDWDQFSNSTIRMPLSPFSDAESRAFLAARGITDETYLAAMTKLAGGIPLLLAIAAMGASTAADSASPVSSMAELFLRMIPEQAKHDIAMAASLPRFLNEDVLGVLSPPQNTADLFNWICGLLFVVRHPDYRWTYHDIVRMPMLRFFQNKSPSKWIEQHQRLGEFYAKQALTESANSELNWHNQRWIGNACESRYHLLCADPAGQLAGALAEMVRAADAGPMELAIWIRMLADAGRDSADADLCRWAQNLGHALVLGGEHFFTVLIDNASLNDPTRALAHELRGECYSAAGDHELAMSDFNRAVDLSEGNGLMLARRGVAHLVTADLPAALSDLTQAHDLNQRSADILVCRALAYQTSGRSADAAADFAAAIDLAPGYAWFEAGLGLSQLTSGRREEAISSYSMAIKRLPDFAWAYGGRGVSHLASGHHDDAIADLIHALSIDDSLSWAHAGLGLSYYAAGRTAEAVRAYGALLDTDAAATASMDSSLASRLLTCRAMAHVTAGDDHAAIADLTSALALDNTLAWAFAHRGQVHQAIASKNGSSAWASDPSADARDEEASGAIADFTSAIRLRPRFTWALARRGGAYRAAAAAGSFGADFAQPVYAKAVTDYSAALDLDPDDGETSAFRGLAQLGLGLQAEALADLERAVRLDPALHWPRILIDEFSGAG